jgi:metal-dependent hydrolase (beta-lactamase superfamily II)
LEKTIRALKDYRIEHFIPCHCTGVTIASRLSREFEKIFHFPHVGVCFEF